MLDLKMKASDVGDYIGWMKVLISICSAAVAALLYKYDASPYMQSVKWSALAFCVALVLFLVTFSGLIDHKADTTGSLAGKTKWPLLIGYVSFLLGFAILVGRMF